VFQVGNMHSAKSEEGVFPFQGNSDMTKALQNLIDIKQADSLDPEDRERILGQVYI